LLTLYFYEFCIGRNELEFILEIIQWVNSILVKNTYFQVAQYPGSRAQYVKPLLDVERNDSTCMIGIFEIGGIDKTIAKAIYNSIASLTDGSCSLENIRQTSNQKGMIHLLSNVPILWLFIMHTVHNMRFCSFELK
jgi:hypothetical protein